MAWFGVRNLYHFGTSEAEKNIYEERIVSIEAEDFEAAHAKGLAESINYSNSNKFGCHSEQEVYKQDGKTLIDGYEVWSVLYESEKNMDEFYAEHYEAFEYDPNNGLSI